VPPESRRPNARRLRSLLAAAPLAALAACGGGDGGTVLTVYSPHGKELLEYYERGFEAANPGVDVQWVDMGSQEVLERLRAEKVNPQADLWFGAPADLFERAAADSLLTAYRPTWAAAVAAESHDPADLWYGTYLTPEVIGYNTELVTAADAPKDWDDVLDPRWKGKVIIRDPVASGSMRAIFGAQMVRSMRETGSPQAGYAWLRRLDANTREYTYNPTILYTKLARGEGLVTLYNMPDIALLEQQRGMKVGYVIPTSGTPLLVDAIAIVRRPASGDSADARRAELARRYYEFVTTPQALYTAADSFLRIPARTDLVADSLPQWIREANERITPMPLDRALLADSLDAWMTYWDRNIRNQGGKDAAR
jgi:iron(III) transport system substrate-binding protein